MELCAALPSLLNPVLQLLTVVAGVQGGVLSLSEIMGRMLDSTQLKLQVSRQGSACEALCVQSTKAPQLNPPYEPQAAQASACHGSYYSVLHS